MPRNLNQIFILPLIIILTYRYISYIIKGGRSLIRNYLEVLAQTRVVEYFNDPCLRQLWLQTVVTHGKHVRSDMALNVSHSERKIIWYANRKRSSKIMCPSWLPINTWEQGRSPTLSRVSLRSCHSGLRDHQPISIFGCRLSWSLTG